MIKTVLWDFDGVILDSMKLKGDGFVELFKDFDKKYLDELYQFHFENGGVSRFEKIKYFYNEILKKKISDDKVVILAGRFANIIEKKLYDKNNLIEETVDFIKANYKKYNFHIVSGAENNELNKLCDYFELSQYFISINGSPAQKSMIVKNTIFNYHYLKEETILIGDAMTDYNASLENGIEFYGYNNIKLNKFKYIDDFSGFHI